ncbi:hypothetical protein AMTRI_Chr06g201030 [Amborella trichopoda]
MRGISCCTLRTVKVPANSNAKILLISVQTILQLNALLLTLFKCSSTIECIVVFQFLAKFIIEICDIVLYYIFIHSGTSYLTTVIPLERLIFPTKHSFSCESNLVECFGGSISDFVWLLKRLALGGLLQQNRFTESYVGA